ncbi:hypothetical protein Agub_g9512 [Astrephomene gubernaculifera]|uniref:RING-CH-type domain-containing protein n=1 Tax=Astrephomene gubernaculifera TaxID=47775 RepID=A0AAD3DV86_9CHLO|nr:hypothetical protein Agub_g9512 [Astrephomene gubernaculifera]
MEGDAASNSSQSDARQCRICWGEEGDPAAGLSLVSPCKCLGSLNYIHVRCLRDWQQVLRSQNQFHKARHCEICKQPYRLSHPAGCGGRGGSGWWACISHATSRASQNLLDSLSCRSYLALLYRGWKLYVLGSSLMGATRVGLAGLRAGFSMGKTLVEEQTSILLSLLSALGELMGTPFAELLWCQAVACVAFALVSEMLYTSALGLLAGGAIGFFRGYVAAVHSSFRLLTSGLARSLCAGRRLGKVAALALRLPGGALRAAAALAAKSLPVKLLLL